MLELACGGFSMFNSLDSFITQIAENSGYPKTVIQYSIRLWAIAFVQAIVLCLVSVVFFDTNFFLSFLIPFFPTRLLIEGYHCKNVYSCTIFSTIIFIGICILSGFGIKHTEFIYLSEIILCSILSVQIVIIFKDKNRFKYNTLALLIGIVTLIAFFVKRDVYTLNGVYSYIMVFVLSIPNILAGGEKDEE